MRKKLKTHCTLFEAAVYRAVKKIPKGKVCSYQWVAGQAGRPAACRAVGNALNKNPYPVVVPCHRVVKSDGSIGGFAKGQEAKLKLLRAEGLTPGKIRDIMKKRNR